MKREICKKIPLKKLLICVLMIAGFAKASELCAQQVDSIYFNLYTDSLKRNIHNYINVDGKRPDGKFIPLDVRTVVFESTAGKWEGNSIFFDSSYKQPSVTITAYLKNKPEIRKTITLFFKTYIPVEVLKSEQELLDEWRSKPKKKKGTNEI